MQRFKRLSSSTQCNNTNISMSSASKSQIKTNQEPSIAYERPWDTLQTSLINSLSPPLPCTNNHSGCSLQKIPSTEESKQHCPSPFCMVSPTINTCRHSACSPDDKHNVSHTNNGGTKLCDENLV